MRIKLQTKITLIYALIFTMVLVAMNAAVFLIVRFYNDSSDNLQISRTRTIVESVLSQSGRFTQADLEDQGIHFPVIVRIE